MSLVIPFVVMLKIHCCAEGSQRNAASGVVEATASSTVAVTVPAIRWTRKKLRTTPRVPTEAPFASQTRNFAGTVLPAFHRLEPSRLIGCRIVWPVDPRHAVDAEAYTMESWPGLNVR